jgi:N-acetyl sugar amidotransferase
MRLKDEIYAYQQCKRCVMDNKNDTNISFNEEGYCNYCSEFFDNNSNNEIKNTELKLKKLSAIIEKIKKEGVGKKYDCIVGVSGGIDSAYLVYKAVEFGLRPLAVHYDNGWNSEIATQNIELLLKKLNVDLYTYVNDWEEFKDVQLSFFKAGVIDIELITDHAISAILFKTSIKYNTKYILQGHNQSSESILPNSWYHWKHDALNIKSIHQKFGTKPIKTLPLMTFFEEYYHLKYRKTTPVFILDFIDYNKIEAQKELSNKIGWKNYGTKHSESIFTRFYQNYILPVKFNVDKRKAHLSSLICSGQITREDALKELSIDVINSKQTIEDKEYVLKKFSISEQIFNSWMKQKPIAHLAYPSYLTRHDKYMRKLKKFFGR